MVILEAEVYFEKRISGYPFYYSGTRIPVKIKEGKEGYSSEIRSLNNEEQIQVETTQFIEVNLFWGEFILPDLKEELVFEFISGSRTVGHGIIKKIREIYITSESLKLIDDIEERRKIVRLAETMENAIVFEDVYLMI